MDLPQIIPIFPLPNVVLFPDVPLPLHIFEPRYRDMVRDVSSSHELVGMTLMRGEPQAGTCGFFEIGCAGRIVSVEKLPDGRFNILLRGVREFRVIRHIADRSTYHQAEVEWRSGSGKVLGASRRQALAQALSRFIRNLPESPAHRLLNDPTVSDELLVNFISFALDIDPLEKQGLLQAETTEMRAQRLMEIIEFHLDEARLTVGRSGNERCH
jgi:Lon protease-like protein